LRIADSKTDRPDLAAFVSSIRNPQSAIRNRMNRRDFLHPRQFAQAAGQVLGALHDPAPPPPVMQEVALLRLSHRAMATTFEIVLPFATPHAVQLSEPVFDLLDRLESQLTVYRDTSEVVNINRLAPHAPVVVEERLFALLELAARLTAETEGAFDVTAGALVKAWGFFRGPRRVPPDDEREAALARTGMRHVVLTPEQRTVRFLRPGLEINLGSIGKGYAVDRMAELLRDDYNIPAFLLHGGHSSVYAKGTPDNDPRGWAVGLKHPWDEERRLGQVWLRDRALGTSAATFRHLEHQGHNLDPRSGWPAEGIASATVLAPTAAEADALATAFFVLGIDKARDYCAAHPGTGAVLLPDRADARPVVIGLGPHEIALD
jgi:thiamine biosynthesis lipoprotein